MKGVRNFVRLSVPKKIIYCVRYNLFALLALLMTWIGSFIFILMMQNIFGNNGLVLIVNVFIHGGDAMRWILGEKALVFTNGVV